MRLVRAGSRSIRGSSRRFGKGALVMAIVIGALGALLAWAWLDGGRQPLREIVQPIPVPEQAR